MHIWAGMQWHSLYLFSAEISAFGFKSEVFGFRCWLWSFLNLSSIAPIPISYKLPSFWKVLTKFLHLFFNEFSWHDFPKYHDSNQEFCAGEWISICVSCIIVYPASFMSDCLHTFSLQRCQVLTVYSLKIVPIQKLSPQRSWFEAKNPS